MTRAILLLLGALMLSAAPLAFAPDRAVAAQRPPVTSAITETRLAAHNLTAAARFGAAVALDGDTAVIGAPGDGAAYVFRYNGSGWVEQARLTPGNHHARDRFGAAVAISGGTIVVGAPGRAANGAAYVFQHSAQGWTETVQLLPDQRNDIAFGWSVAIDGATIVVGAPYRFSGGESINSGSATIFRVGPTGWGQVARLSAGRNGGPVLSDLFGWSVAISGATVVVGAYLDDTAYVYGEGADGWAATGRLRGSDTARNDRFGWSVAIDGATIIVGAVQYSAQSRNAGAAYLFQRNEAGWTETARLTADERMPGSRFGWSVALSGATVIVGARESKGDRDREEAGAAYVFQSDGTTWSRRTALFAGDAAAFAHFGATVAASNGHILIGAPDGSPESSATGAAYIYALGQRLNTTP